LKNVRIEHIDLRQRLLHIPRPKGGEEKAFAIPLSRPMIRCIIRAIRFGQILYPEHAKHWLFPADSETGHLVEHKEERDVVSKWGNDLRQSYRTLAILSSELFAEAASKKRLSSVPTADRECVARLHQSRRIEIRCLPILRVLRPFWLRSQCQG
jgi:hypothetical protein